MPPRFPKKPSTRKPTPYLKRHKNGTPYAQGWILGDKMTGYWEFYRLDGTRMRTGYYDNGEQSGTWTTYDEKGKEVKVTKIKPKPKKKEKIWYRCPSL